MKSGAPTPVFPRALRIERLAPRYYSEFAFLVHLPVAREFLTWNCAMLIAESKTA